MNAYTYAFLLGVVFVVGLIVGLLVTVLVVKAVWKKKTIDADDLNRRIEDRLAKYVEHTERIADALESISNHPRFQ